MKMVTLRQEVLSEFAGARTTRRMLASLGVASAQARPLKVRPRRVPLIGKYKQLFLPMNYPKPIEEPEAPEKKVKRPKHVNRWVQQSCLDLIS